MPYFTPDDIDIDPSEFVDSCNTREKERLVEILEEDGYITTSNKDYGVRRPNVNDEKFWESLETLAKCRDLLTVTEEQFINNLADRFKYLR